MKKVFIYTNFSCQACRRLKEFLRRHDVSFDYVDIDRLSGEDRDVQKEKAHRLSGGWDIPVVQVGAEVRVGFDPDWLAEALGLPDAGMGIPVPGEDWVGNPSLAPRREALRVMFDPLARALGYKFTPELQEAEFLLEQVARNETVYGMPFCPCKMVSGSRELDLRIVCPCIPFHRKHFDSMKRCWCGLFVHEDVQEPRMLKQVPEQETGK
ncbi:MAG: ferredoxin-thioredoxin reductase catalytic domain-containing protein [bacterium]